MDKLKSNISSRFQQPCCSKEQYIKSILPYFIRLRNLQAFSYIYWVFYFIKRSSRGFTWAFLCGYLCAYVWLFVPCLIHFYFIMLKHSFHMKINKVDISLKTLEHLFFSWHYKDFCLITVSFLVSYLCWFGCFDQQ